MFCWFHPCFEGKIIHSWLLFDALCGFILAIFIPSCVAFLYTVILTLFKPGPERLFPVLIKDWQFTVSPTTDWHFRCRGFLTWRYHQITNLDPEIDGIVHCKPSISGCPHYYGTQIYRSTDPIVDPTLRSKALVARHLFAPSDSGRAERCWLSSKTALDVSLSLVRSPKTCFW